ncbi:hypothetical protein BOTBODRAFT_179821 [Botryobasidium botryosum FD-172 SS1]|uniref:TauD/TfdA-like domain-containing protein n=1 Tax=Botryobasidium botryosum (strain FD-172 SS1) TaxID=930990 RepID=A0A067M188_BOTB1|nr:hypothetical protein BOTBODRAFT_179821 [Botryobasidium botryosum FD-172 SS1]
MASPKQPDISYHPDEKKFKERTVRRLAEDPSLPQAPLPAGFPTKICGPIVWEGKDWKDEKQWVYQLNPTELEEIDGALAYFKGLGKPMGYIAEDTFPLPTLSASLKKLAHELYSGRGFFVLRTIPVDQYSKADLVIIYAGISSYVGSARGKQDGTGAVLAHIKDLTVSHAHEKGGVNKTAYTTDKQVFHNDLGDLVALLVLETAAEGGLSLVSSCGRIYNEIAATRPDLIQTLSEPWPLDSFGGDPGYTTRPLLLYEDGKIIIQYSRRLLTGYNEQKRSANIPPITEAQAEALDMLHFLAEKYAMGITFQKGDIEYINNMGLLHAREAFRDDDKSPRHLLRLWLRDEELGWKTPKPLAPIWTRLFSIGPEEQRFPIEPEIARKAGITTTPTK